MANTSSRRRFSTTVKLLIAGQIMALMVAAAAALWATQAGLDRGKARATAEAALAEAKAQTDAAQTATRAFETVRLQAAGAQAEAEAARRLAQAYALIAARSRNVLLAASPGDFREAALEMDSELSELTYDGVPLLSEGSEVAVLSLLAIAQFRSDLPNREAKALDSVDRAIRLNDARLAQAPSLNALVLNESLYLEKLSYICAARPGDAAALGAALDTFPPIVIAALTGKGALTHHYALRSACAPGTLQALAQSLDHLAGEGKATSEAELFKIRRIFINAQSETQRPFAERAGQALDHDYELEGFASTGQSFRPGVRYYYPNQKSEAEAIARRVEKAYGETWPDIRFDAVLLKGYQGLARDQVEVWLPAPTPQSPT